MREIDGNWQMHQLLPLILFLGAFPAIAAAQDASVNPGINEPFRNPDVGSFIERFEREGREVYDRREQIVAKLGLKPGMAVADIGCGTGLFTRLLGPAVGEDGKVYAVDIAKKFVDYTLLSCGAKGSKNVEGVVCAPDSVNLPPKSIDFAFICDTYHHFEFPFKTMASILQALKPGGSVVVIDFERIPGKSSDWILNHVRAGKEEVTREILASGFVLAGEETEMFEQNWWRRFVSADAAPKP